MPDLAPSPVAARAVAMRLLARREYGFAELIGKLAERGIERDTAEQVAQNLADEGLQSDSRFTEMFVRSRISRGKGPRLIRAELGRRQIDDSVIERAMTEIAPEWSELAADVRRRKFGDEPPPDIHDRSRQSRFLESRGFTADHIRHAMRDAMRADE